MPASLAFLQNGIPPIHVNGGDDNVVNLLVDESLDISHLFGGVVVGVGEDQVEPVGLTECVLHRLGVCYAPVGLIRFALGKAYGDQAVIGIGRGLVGRGLIGRIGFGGLVCSWAAGSRRQPSRAVRIHTGC